MRTFGSAREKIGRFDVRGRTVLVPLMHPTGSEFVAAAFRGIGVRALVMETCVGLELGKEFTSGKECYPCQITLGDVLHHLRREQERLGPAFSAERYAYFMPEADGPCRFGMYNKMQRLVLDRFPEFREVPIAAITTGDGYHAAGLVPEKDATAFRLMVYMSLIVADILDRIAWRARPYERERGAVDGLFAEAVAAMVRTLESGGLARDFEPYHRLAEETARRARGLMAPGLPRRPRVGIVGEIYLRSHPESNQQLIRRLEEHGAEIVDASLAEWISFVTYTRARDQRRAATDGARRRDLAAAGASARKWLGSAIEYRYLNRCRHRLYARALRHLDIEADHSIHEVERELDGDRHFSFDIGTESALSIGGALAHLRHGYNGIVNVYPFTCMPGTIATSVLGPLLARARVPYLETPCDGSTQPNREVAIQTFVYQAAQHRRLQGNGRH